jgi:prophage regulatory protein
VTRNTQFESYIVNAGYLSIDRKMITHINPQSLEVSDRVLNTRQVADLTNLHPVTLWRLARRGEFPAPIKITARKNGWPLSTVLAWLSQRPHANYGANVAA